MRPKKESPPTSPGSEIKKRFLLGALDRYERPLTAYAMRLTGGDLHKSRDAVQHTYMQLCKQAVKDIEPKLAPWLYTVCRNQILDDSKSSFNQKSSPVDFDTIDHNATDPAMALETDELLRTLKGLFCCLGQTERDVIELWSHGLDAGQVAEVLDKKPATVRVNLHRAIKRLKQHPQVTKWLERATGQVVKPDGPDGKKALQAVENPPTGLRSPSRNGKVTPVIKGEQS